MEIIYQPKKTRTRYRGWGEIGGLIKANLLLKINYMETSMFVVWIVIGCILWLTIGLVFWWDAYDRVTNDQELRTMPIRNREQLGNKGECVIIPQVVCQQREHSMLDTITINRYEWLEKTKDIHHCSKSEENISSEKAKAVMHFFPDIGKMVRKYLSK